MGLALVAMAEDLGRDMAYRSLEHLLQYGEPHVRCGHGLRQDWFCSSAGISHAHMQRPSCASSVEVFLVAQCSVERAYTDLTKAPTKCDRHWH